MKVKVNVRETAEFEVWLEVEDPDDRNLMEAAWTNLPDEQAQAGLIGYDDRQFTVLDTESIYPNMALDKLIDTLRETWQSAKDRRSALLKEGHESAANAAGHEAFGLERALHLAISHRDAFEGKR